MLLALEADMAEAADGIVGVHGAKAEIRTLYEDHYEGVLGPLVLDFVLELTDPAPEPEEEATATYAEGELTILPETMRQVVIDAEDPGAESPGCQETYLLQYPPAEAENGANNSYAQSEGWTKNQFLTGPDGAYWTFSNWRGINVACDSTTLRDPTMGGFAIFFENPFWEHDTWLSECQGRAYSSYEEEGETKTWQRRFWMSGAAWDATVRGAANWFGHEVDRFKLFDGGAPGSPSRQKIDFKLEINEFDIHDGGVFRFLKNDVSIFSQIKADESGYVGWKLSDRDSWETTAPIEVNGASAPNALGLKVMHTLFDPDIAISDAGFQHRGEGVKPIHYAGQVSYECSFALFAGSTENRHASGQIISELRANGRVMRAYNRVGTEWTAGADNDGNFKIAPQIGALSSPAVTFRRSDKAMMPAGPIVFDVAKIPNHANDTAAAAGGVPVGGVYRNGSALMVRVS
jgi:hypothetical protein